MINEQQHENKIADFLECFADRLKIERGSVVGFHTEHDERLVHSFLTKIFDSNSYLIAGPNKKGNIKPGQVFSSINFSSTRSPCTITLVDNCDKRNHELDLLTFFNIFADCSLPINKKHSIH